MANFGGFIYSKSMEEFLSQAANGNVSEYQLGIIEDVPYLYTHGKFYQFVTVTSDPSSASLSVSPSSVTVSSSGETFYVYITTNKEYSVSFSSSWLTLDSDSGDGTLAFTATENTDVSSRSITITITAEDLTSYVTVTQSAAAVTLSVSPTSVSLDSDASSFTLTVTTNTTYSVSLSDSWMSVSSDSDGTVEIAVEENTDTDDRSGTVTVTAGTSSVTISVAQAAPEVISFDNRYTYAYGVQRTVGQSSYSLTRIGNSDMHASLPVQSQMRGCLLDDDGNVTQYLDEDSWEDEDLSGDSGQVMVELPEHWAYWSNDGTTQEAWISDKEIDGFTHIPKMYVGAYPGVVSNSLLCSISGSSATGSVSLTDFRTYARNRGDAGLNSCGWNCMAVQAWRTIYWLYTIEYASTNSQDDYTSELDSNGYHQGGLGQNVYSSYAYATGKTDSIGNGTGVVDYSTSGQYYQRYRGLEDLFGNVGTWLDGVLRYNYVYYFTDDPSEFSSEADTTMNSCTSAQSLTSNGWIMEIAWDEYGNIFPISVGGSSSTYFCDYSYNANSGTRAVRVGRYGSTSSSYAACSGLSYSYANGTPSGTATYIGSRLCFLPSTD